MTDLQFKQLAGLTLANSRLISRIATGYTQLLGQIMPLLPDQEGGLSLLSELEQIEALLAEALAAIPQAKKDFGLE